MTADVNGGLGFVQAIFRFVLIGFGVGAFSAFPCRRCVVCLGASSAGRWLDGGFV